METIIQIHLKEDGRKYLGTLEETQNTSCPDVQSGKGEETNPIRSEEALGTKPSE